MIFISQGQNLIYFNPFVANAPFLYPLKASENLKVIWVIWAFSETFLVV